MSVGTAGEMIDLSLNIRRLREARGWSMSELARRLGTKHPTIWRWERPVTSMSLNSLSELADIFGVSMRELLSPLPTQSSPNSGAVVTTATFEGLQLVGRSQNAKKRQERG